MYRLDYSQVLPITLNAAWDFFSSPLNLGLITPNHLDFQMCYGTGHEKMYAGQLIVHRLKPLLNMPVEWITEITHVNAPYYFVDEQRKGPYTLWHHEHHFKLVEGGVEVRDLVFYRLPFGPLGVAMHSLFIKRKVEAIFDYRKKKLIEIFNA